MSPFSSINLNTIVVITLLLLVIILLSGVKVCNTTNMNNMNKVKKDDIRFIDSRYSYISEPFEATPDPIIKQFGDFTQERIDKTLQKTLDQEKKNLQIYNLKSQVESIENKISVLQQMS
jgi:hypothetical protein